MMTVSEIVPVQGDRLFVPCRLNFCFLFIGLLFLALSFFLSSVLQLQPHFDSFLPLEFLRLWPLSAANPLPIRVSPIFQPKLAPHYLGRVIGGGGGNIGYCNV